MWGGGNQAGIPLGSDRHSRFGFFGSSSASSTNSKSNSDIDVSQRPGWGERQAPLLRHQYITDSVRAADEIPARAGIPDCTSSRSLEATCVGQLGFQICGHYIR